MSTEDYERLLFREMLRDIFAATDDCDFAYLLGKLDGATELADKLCEVRYVVR